MPTGAKKKNPLDFIGTDYDEYTVIAYCGLNSSNVHTYEVKFKETGNKYIRTKHAIVKGIKDLDKKAEDAKKKKAEERKKVIIKERTSRQSCDSIEYIYGDFDISKPTLVLDQATITTGFVVLIDSIVASMGFLRQDSREDLAIRIASVKKDIIKIIKEHNIKNIVMEEIFLASNLKTYRALCMLIGVIIDLCIENDISCSLVLASVWRSKYDIKGTRSACKSKALNIIRTKFSINISKEEEDLAEAILIAYYILDKHNKDNMFNWD